MDQWLKWGRLKDKVSQATAVLPMIKDVDNYETDIRELVPKLTEGKKTLQRC